MHLELEKRWLLFIKTKFLAYTVHDIQQSSAIKCIDFRYESPYIMACGTSEGNISFWNTREDFKIDEILSDPLWIKNEKFNFLGWMDPEKHHTGSIVAISISPSLQFVASGSNDNTCKVWCIDSYQKNHENIQNENKVYQFN